MDSHNFKIGDSVKLRSSFCGISGNDIGRVIGINAYIEVLWKGCLRERLGEKYPHRPDEIYKVPTKGKQLEFDFMSKAIK